MAPPDRVGERVHPGHILAATLGVRVVSMRIRCTWRTSPAGPRRRARVAVEDVHETHASDRSTAPRHEDVHPGHAIAGTVRRVHGTDSAATDRIVGAVPRTGPCAGCTAPTGHVGDAPGTRPGADPYSR